MRYVDRVIVPYFESTRVRLGLPANQQGIAIFDVYRAHRGEELLQLLRENHISPIFVPAACTDRLQPMDLAANKLFKDMIKREFQQWYGGRVCESLNGGNEETTIGLKLSELKPIHAKWLVTAVQQVSTRTDYLIAGFKEAGILDCFTIE